MTDDDASRTDRVWHRALGPGPASRLPGDRAAHAALELHGMVMNGGVLNAVETSDDAYLRSAEDAFRWLGLDEIGDLLRDVRLVVAVGGPDGLADAATLERESDDRYDRVLPADSDLEAALQRRVADSPDAFS